MPQLAIDTFSIKKEVCQECFFEFVQEFWWEINTEPPVWNWHIEYLCDELQAVAERVFKRLPRLYDLIINISPGSTKSTICSQMFPAWVWTRMPTAQFICTSFRDTTALKDAVKMRDIVQSVKYQAMFGPLPLRDDQNTKGKFQNVKGGHRFSSVHPTGEHGHFVIIDDPLNPTEAVSKVELQAKNDWMEHTLPSRKVNKEVTPTILIMQRLHQNDPSGLLLEKAEEKRKRGDNPKLKHICLPADTSFEVKPPELKSKYIDGLMDPIRLSREVLKDNRDQLGEVHFAGQFGQSPVPPGGAAFQVEKLKVDTPPVDRHFLKRVRYWDKAGSDGMGDWTVGALIGKDLHGRFWVLDIVRGQWDSFTRENVIRQTAEIDGADVEIGVEQEAGSGGKDSALATVRNLAGFRVFVERPTGDKASRADPFATQVNGENVYLARGGTWHKAYIEELRFFPLGTHDDQVDASSGAFNRINSRKKRAGAIAS